jgi:uncharacterized protein (TIGR02646 family)
MRTVRRGASPRAIDFSDYVDAKVSLVSRLGLYCSYCERHVATNLAVEHIQPKGLPQYKGLEGRWENFLLACVNCNSTKGDKDVVLPDVLLPDRDNTTIAFNYCPDGSIEVSTKNSLAQQTLAQRLLSLVGLDVPISLTLDENGKQIALDRVSQRMEIWGTAQEAKVIVDANPTTSALRDMAVRMAQASGFYSIWMTVFSGDTDMRNRLIHAFPGTHGSGCHNSITTHPACPAPNPDRLAHGSKM